MALVFLDNTCVTLTSKLEKTDTNLPVSAADKATLCGALGNDDYSYLTLSTSLGVEIVKVSCMDGEPFIERAQGSSESVTGSVGRCLCFKVNQLVLDEYLTGATACTVTVESADTAYVTVTEPEEGNCNWTVDLSQELKDRLDVCCPEDDCDCGNCTLANGTYENATITIIDGKVCAIENGKNIVYTGGSCCSCSSCEEEAPVEE